MIVTVGDVAAGGHCVARVDGEVYFVRHALPGETVRIEINERKKRFAFADAVEVIEASPDRVEPPCAFAGPGKCGGCDFQHATPESQRRLKAKVLFDQLTRIGGMDPKLLEDVEVEELPWSEGALGWRTRMQYAVDPSGRPGLRAHKSHDIIPIDKCSIATERIRESDVLTLKWDGMGAVGVVDADDDQLAVYTQLRRTARPHHKSGPKQVHQTVDGHEFEIGFDGFWQVHPAAAPAFLACALEFLQPREGESAWDLYAGAGLFASGLSEAVGETGRVVAIENAASSRTAANLAAFKNAGAIEGDVAAIVPDLGSVDLVVLDPPRSGAGPEVVVALGEARPRAICYVACDAGALARDASDLAIEGYELKRLRAFDAFPMTQHFETIALFEPVD
ncbi:class I SAM-dependent RNA methyltransferase [Glycomyces harbinensis]|uniref:tRNA/tmRNA/rRNA uracil-C5-methylase, TrmA/RlmC/RlmD family n=1 Tax=Glycomyces harbinensis TaxID=58114 RepID=A0A1G6U225_9ACTN|nr:TRAM domain-containing protein [Glycomyces harbinensis]SDD35452.1 tRNA/tmRNA/rRNA uracil-C5-methylase, TrmA/RlmC/RlmD family [Glycomyces harbinensis]